MVKPDPSTLDSNTRDVKPSGSGNDHIMNRRRCFSPMPLFHGAHHACHKVLLHQEKDERRRHRGDDDSHHDQTIIRRIAGAQCGD